MMGNWNVALAVLRTAVAAAVVLLLPGYAGVQALSKVARRELGFALVLGLSLALHPLVALWLTMTKVRLTTATLWATYLGCGVLTLLALIMGQPTSCRKGRIGHRLRNSGLMIGLFSLVLAVRLVQIRDLAVPAWVDSLHHTLIVRLITEQGSIPSDFEPYVPAPFFYHFGFHSLAAAFGQLAGLGAPQAILILGQVLNAAVILTVYRLTFTLTRQRAAGIVAAALTGLVSQMPAYYVAWGRYTLLTGMVLLPMTMTVAVETWREPGHSVWGVLLAVLTGGLILTHYIATMFYGIFLITLILSGSVRKQPESSFRRGRRTLWLLMWSILGIGLVSPWLLHLLRYVNVRLEVWPIRTANEAYFPNYLGYLWRLVRQARNWVLLLLALPGVVFAVVRRRPVKLLFVWATVMLLLFNSWWWRLWPVRLDLVLICLFVPICVLAGYGLVIIQRELRKRLRASIFGHTALFVTVLLCVWGIKETRSIVKPVSVLATRADTKAIAWIKENTPPDARFLINVEPWWHSIYRGTDGGWWISVLGDRETILPPFCPGWGDREYIYKVSEVARRVRALQSCDSDLWELIEEQNITHVYLGVKGGSLQSMWFEDCPGIWPVYDLDGVRIYEIRQVDKPCSDQTRLYD